MSEKRISRCAAEGPGPSRALRAWTVGHCLLGLLAAALAGCGGGERRTASHDLDSGAMVTVPVHETSRDVRALAAAATALDGVQSERPSGGSPAPVPEGGMPPDIVVSASNTRVVPGEVIDIVVEATPDVVEMSLWDGIGGRLPMVYDADLRAWHVAYRVPLKLPWERTGLAVTAKNEDRRWRRAWVFIETQRPGSLADSSGGAAAPLADGVHEHPER
jgi:hypothetical protein